uniref:Putative C1q domain containing protein MgC1q62 n=1 Tax=Mytilus galloprovincialis TaxID=29158 RepID=F0V499_MYTGA|nr:putative C1q domain containing protein MgC1q62 [Mytilus galloprovincialis]
MFGVWLTGIFFVTITISASYGDDVIESLQFDVVFLKTQMKELTTKLDKSNILIDNLTKRLEVSEKRNDELNTQLSSTGNCTHSQDRKRLLLSGSTSTGVAFSVRLTKQLTGLSAHQAVVFDMVVTDTLQAYNNNDGIFAAPITGMYVFFWTTAVKQYERTQLLVNGVPYGYASADAANDGDTDYGSASQIVVLKVNKNQHVWISTLSGSGALDGYNDNTFSGWLLYPLE